MKPDQSEFVFRLAEVGDAQALSNYYINNATHLQNSGPTREPGFDSPDVWRLRLSSWETQHRERLAAHFVSLNSREEIVACCNLSNVVFGGFMACHMGYGIAKAYEGRGLMKSLCLEAIDFAFQDLGLNRIMANYVPSNERSGKLLASLGFVIEGRAARYLKINGVWQDHVLTSLINPEPVQS